MTIEEFYRLPERPIKVRAVRGFGMVVPHIEGEAILESWRSPDGFDWWSETINGVRYRCRYVTE